MLIKDPAELIHIVFTKGMNFNIWGCYDASSPIPFNQQLEKEEKVADVINMHLFDVNGIVDKIGDTITISTSVQIRKKCVPVRTSIISLSDRDNRLFDKIIRTHTEAAIMVINKDYNQFLRKKSPFSDILDRIEFSPSPIDVTDMIATYCQVFENESPFEAKSTAGQYKDFTLANANPDDKTTNRSILSLVEETGLTICNYFDAGRVVHAVIKYQSKDSLGNDIQVVSEIDCDNKFNGLLLISSLTWFDPYHGEDDRQAIGEVTSFHAKNGAEDIMKVVRDEIYSALYFIYKITSNQISVRVKIYDKNVQEEIYV